MKTYCLRCEVQSPCKCGLTDKMFKYSDKIRTPRGTSNKVVFRKFLDDCPAFVNLIPESLQEDFLHLLRKIKYFNKSINGRDWTNITK